RWQASGQLRFRPVEEWLPGQRLAAGLVQMPVLQEFSHAPEIFAEERRVRQIVNSLAGCPQSEFPGGGQHRQDGGPEIPRIVRPFGRRGPRLEAVGKVAELVAETSQFEGP